LVGQGITLRGIKGERIDLLPRLRFSVLCPTQIMANFSIERVSIRSSLIPRSAVHWPNKRITRETRGGAQGQQ